MAKPDLVTPGRHLVSLRSPGSQVDRNYPYFVSATNRYGSGTSFSAGIASGAAAVLLGADVPGFGSDEPEQPPRRPHTVHALHDLRHLGGVHPHAEDHQIARHRSPRSPGPRTPRATTAKERRLHPDGGSAPVDSLEIVTLYYGAGMQEADAQAIAAHIREAHPGLAVEVVQGGQPHYPYIVSLE